jgi:TRAP-type C4-dicarboxylate transport system permease large subunit
MATGANIGAALSQAAAAATSAGVTGTAQTTFLQSIGSIFSGLFGSANPNKSTEIALVAQIMTDAGNVPAETGLLASLSAQLGLPPAAQRIVADMQQNLSTLKPSDIEQMGNMIDEIIARGS